MICEYYDIDGKKLTYGHFSLITKSLQKAIVEAEMIAGLPLKLIGNEFAIMGHGNKHLVVSRQS